MVPTNPLAAWCEAALGSRIAETIFERGNLSRVLGVSLADGRKVVIKVRPWEDRLRGCLVVQRQIARAGYPCPAPVSSVGKVEGWAVHAEALIPGGEQRDPGLGAAAYAALLGRLIAATPAPERLPPLLPSPPWTAWDHSSDKTWPDRDDRGIDLNRFPGPDWLDDAARRVRKLLGAYAAPLRVGHGDWESQNIRWHGDEPLVVHDWDSVIAQPEATIVGLAAAVWAAEGRSGGAADVAQTTDFISAYERVRGPLSRQDRAAAWAAGLWVRLFNAKKDATKGGGPHLHRLRGELHERLQHAGLDP